MQFIDYCKDNEDIFINPIDDSGSYDLLEEIVKGRWADTNAEEILNALQIAQPPEGEPQFEMPRN